MTHGEHVCNENMKLSFAKMADLQRRIFARNKNEVMTLERWNADGPNACPCCIFLDSLGWVPLGSLPEQNCAHSQLGGPDWKSGDDSCMCTKDYKEGRAKYMSSDMVFELWCEAYDDMGDDDDAE